MIGFYLLFGVLYSHLMFNTNKNNTTSEQFDERVKTVKDIKKEVFNYIKDHPYCSPIQVTKAFPQYNDRILDKARIDLLNSPKICGLDYRDPQGRAKRILVTYRQYKKDKRHKQLPIESFVLI